MGGWVGGWVRWCSVEEEEDDDEGEEEESERAGGRHCFIVVRAHIRAHTP